MILAHHGADNGFTNERFLEAVRPKIAISSSNYDNHHGHPKETIRELLYRMDIKLFTTKTGDVIAKSIGDHSSKYQVTNLISHSTVVSSDDVYPARKAKLLSMNTDTIKNIYHPGFKGLKAKR
jgi:competence protein ComEC